MNEQSNQLAMDRRHFLKQSALLGAGLATYGAVASLRASESANEKMVVGVMGLGRGMAHVQAALQIPNVEVAYLCDIDDKRIESAIKSVANKQKRAAKGVKDFRHILDDKDVDALFIAAPNHWHAPATIMGCAAGKHVYVEKPASHNPAEGEWMVQAARKYNRVVQMGNQRRSWPKIIEAMERLHGGVIGNVTFARCWYNNSRGSIGRGKPAPIPGNIDYSLWQGPAPERPYKDNLVHYNWHWHWHWGNGELGNNGIHSLDLARWGLNVQFPTRITYNGGRYHYDDDQETPDTGIAVFDFGTKGASWEGSSCHPRPADKLEIVNFYGEKGMLSIVGGGYKIYDPKGKEIESVSGPGGDKVHVENFLNCIRDGKKPTAEIEDGQRSTLLCHLGNIAYRVGHTIHFDPAERKIKKDKQATALWERDYRKGWKPKV